MPNNKKGASGIKPVRNSLPVPYALTVLAIAAAVVSGYVFERQSFVEGAAAAAVQRAASIRLKLADEILGYAVAMRGSDETNTRQLQVALHDTVEHLHELGGLGRAQGIATPAAGDLQLDILFTQADANLKDLDTAVSLLLTLTRPNSPGDEGQMAAAVNAVAEGQNAYVASLVDISDIESGMASAASSRARDGELASAIVIILLAAGGVGLLIAPSQRRAARALEHSIRVQGQNARIGSEVAKHVADRDRRMSEAQFQTLFHSATFGVALTDEAGSIIDSNPALGRITGYAEHEMRGLRFGVWAEDAPEGILSANDVPDNSDAEPVTGRVRRYIRKDGSKIWAEERLSRSIGPDGTTTVCIGFVNDVSARKQALEQLVFDATHDSLTGLFNRKVFQEAVTRAIQSARSGSHQPFAILLVDLDRFKFVNDSRGHSFGDAVLAQVAARLQTWASSQDIVARLGGDEFTVLLSCVGDAEQAEIRTAALQKALSTAMQVGELNVRTSVSIGVCLWSAATESAEEMLQAADAAAYHAKAQGRACSVVYDAEMATRHRMRTSIGLDLRSALEKRELRLVYQPIMDIRLNRCTGFEALLRWAHPELGDISPALFIPVAEESGLMVPIGEWVLGESTRQLAEWRRHPMFSGVSMNVNVSAQQLSSPVFLADLKSVLGENEVGAESIHFELTETAMLDNDSLTRPALAAIRSAGAHLVLDDFGMGYSSLAHLIQLPIDALKIDRMFVGGVDGNLASPEIVRALIALARSMNIDVVAEGVETRQQEAELAAMGCRYAQGYLLSRPLEAAMVSEFMHSLAGFGDRAAQGA